MGTTGRVVGVDVQADGVVIGEPLEISRASVLWYRARRLFGWRDPAEKHIQWAFEESPNGDVAIINFQRYQRVDIAADQIPHIAEWLAATSAASPSRT